MLDAGVRKLAERILPGFVVRRLDPVRWLIDDEVKTAADLTGERQIVLDAGAGEARHRQLFTKGRYIALDIGTGDTAWDYSRLDVRGDLQSLPLREQSVDGILCMVVLEHTREPRAVLEEFSRVLKPGGTLRLIVPFLWEEHQQPHDYFRFTRYGIRLLFESLPFRLELLRPIGGFFWLSARRCVNLLSFFQGGWRWAVFVLMAPFLGLIFPLALFSLDRLDRDKTFSLGFQIRAVKTCGCRGAED